MVEAARLIIIFYMLYYHARRYLLHAQSIRLSTYYCYTAALGQLTTIHRLTVDYYVDCVYIPHGPSPLAVV